MTDHLLTPEAAADALAIPRSRVLDLARGGALGSVRLGPRTIRFRREDIDRYISGAYRESRHDEEAARESERRGNRLPSHGSQKPVGRRRHDRLDARRPSGPPQPLRRVEG